MRATQAKRAVEVTHVVPLWAAEARELRRKVLGEWGPAIAGHKDDPDVRALTRSLDALTRAEVAKRRAAATPDHRKARRMATDRYTAAVQKLGPSAAWVIGMLHTAKRAEVATDPVVCAVLGEDIRRHFTSLSYHWAEQRGRREARYQPSSHGGRAGRGKAKRPHTRLIYFWCRTAGSKPSRGKLLDMLEAEWEEVRDNLELTTKQPCAIDNVSVRRGAETVRFDLGHKSVTLPFDEIDRIIRRATK